MKKTALLAATAAMALSAGSAFAATPGASTAGMHIYAHRFSTPSNLTTLYSQNSNDSGVGLVSDMFGTSFPTYTDQGADDFVVPTGSTWKVKEVDVTGVYFNGAGPATSENVYFYKNNKKNMPGKLVKSYANVAGTDNGTGSFTIKLPSAARLRAGTYWVSVQANIIFDTSGEWGWEINSTQHGNQAMWQNPGGGFAVCPTWGTTESCLGYGPDFMFVLKGKG